jgi:hypothetical protein
VPQPQVLAALGLLKVNPRAFKSVLKINLHTGQVQTMCFVHKGFNTVNNKFLVAILFLVKAQNIAHARTAATFNANAQAKIIANSCWSFNLKSSFTAPGVKLPVQLVSTARAHLIFN